MFDYGIELEVLNVEENNKEELYVITCEVKDFGKVQSGRMTQSALLLLHSEIVGVEIKSHFHYVKRLYLRIYS